MISTYSIYKYLIKLFIQTHVLKTQSLNQYDRKPTEIDHEARINLFKLSHL